MQASTTLRAGRAGGMSTATAARSSAAKPALALPCPRNNNRSADALHAAKLSVSTAAAAGRSIAYTSHEGNSWEVTFQPSGE